MNNPLPDCRYLERYIDRDLTESMAVEAQKHLDSCPICQQRMESDQEVDPQIRFAWSRCVQAPDRLRAQIAQNRTAGQAAQKKPTTGSRYIAPAWIAASIMLVACFATVWLIGGLPNQEPPIRPDQLAINEAEGRNRAPNVQVEFPDDTIHVWPKSQNREFTIIDVYPAVKLKPNRQLFPGE